MTYIQQQRHQQRIDEPIRQQIIQHHTHSHPQQQRGQQQQRQIKVDQSPTRIPGVCAEQAAEQQAGERDAGDCGLGQSGGGLESETYAGSSSSVGLLLLGFASNGSAVQRLVEVLH